MKIEGKLKNAARRAAELRTLADMTERGELDALVWGFSVRGLDGAPEGLADFTMSLQEGDADKVRQMLTSLTAQVNKAPTPAHDVADGMGQVSLRAGEDGEGDYDAFAVYADWRQIVSMVGDMMKGGAL